MNRLYCKQKIGTNLTGLNQKFYEDQYVIQKAFQEFQNDFYFFTITSGRDGKHSVNSRHYVGDAVDIRIRDLQFFDYREFSLKWWQMTQALCLYLSLKLGPEYFIVLEKNHIHLQIGSENLLNKTQNVIFSSK